MKKFLIYFIPYLLMAQSTGTIMGHVKDAKTGEGLPGVNVIVKGTYYGTASGLNGDYRIQNISQGSYDIEISMIGYKVILKTGFIRPDWCNNSG
jgi:hypothetical protein